MNVRAVIALLVACAVGGSALAETIVVDNKVMVRDSSVPRPMRGARMSEVEKQFGEPATRHPTVGKPPITRWDYPDFSVFFERDRVIDAVVPGKAPASAAAAASDERTASNPP
ncbi:MAG TPA: hypothetical protein VMU67_14240 [Steroidobacteraceae bacterium]|nr:hypothetical protein [Steroidobacteraceae bacterium]